MKQLLLLVFILSIGMSACKKDNSENTGNGTGSQQIQLTSYPLTIGNSWEYYTESHVADSTGAIWLSDYYTNYWNALSDTIINGIVCTKISQLDSNYDGSTHLAYTYYANRSDGFYGIAVQNNGGMFYLKTNEILKLTQFDLLGSFGNKTFSNDTAFLPATSLKLLKFPSNTNDIWLSHEYNNPIPDIIKRKYICDTTISTSAGTFNCKKLQMFWDIDNNNLPDSGYSEIYQYFSTKGLIQEEWNEALIFGGSSGIDSLHRITKLVHVNF